MKNKTKIIATIFLAITLVFACKKKDETPTPVNTTPQAPVKGQLYAKVNGSDWYVGKSGMSDLTYVGGSGSNIGFGGQTSSSTPYSEIGINFLNTTTTGTFSLTKTGPYRAHYKHTDGNSYQSLSGTLSVTQIDTTNHLSVLKGTFSFVTDTVSGQSFTITEGAINF